LDFKKKIVGLDSYPVRPIEDRNTLFNEHIRGLRSNPWTKDAYLILMCERNTGMESGAFKQIMDQYPKTAAYNEPEKSNPLSRFRKDMLTQDLIDYYEKTKKNPGFTPCAELKMEALIALRHRLTEHSLFYFKDCVTRNPFMVQYTHVEKFIHTKLELEEEMKRIKEFPTSRLTHDTKKPIVTWSAKTNEQGEIQAGYNDDKVVMLAIACFLWRKAMNYEGSLVGFPYAEIRFSDENDSD